MGRDWFLAFLHSPTTKYYEHDQRITAPQNQCYSSKHITGFCI